MAKSLKKGKDYFGLPLIVSIILQIVGVGCILGIVVRVLEKHYLAAILRFLLAPIMWIVDVVWLILNGQILRVL